jgi:ferredoxin
MAKYRVEVDREKCTGFGACVELCPDSFYLSDDDGKSKIKGGEDIVEDGKNIRDVKEVNELGCLEAAERGCPYNAIKVEEI